MRDGTRTWISVSRWHVPRQQAWRSHIADGFIVLVDGAGARIVADGLHYTNEVRLDPTGTWLYVVETFGRRLSRFRILFNGDLYAKEVVVTFGVYTARITYQQRRRQCVTSTAGLWHPDGLFRRVHDRINPASSIRGLA